MNDLTLHWLIIFEHVGIEWLNITLTGKMVGRLFHNFGAVYKKQLSHDFLERVIQDLLAKDAYIDIDLLIWLNRDKFAIKSTGCTLVKNLWATNKTTKSEI